jgi:hypothetical protein
LLIITFRPEFQQAWSGQPHVTALALSRLRKRDVTALVRELAGNAPLGSEIVEEIVERTDGVPLFIEELTRAVLERAIWSGESTRTGGRAEKSASPAKGDRGRSESDIERSYSECQRTTPRWLRVG